MKALGISSPLVANVLPIINLPMALGNLPIAANGLPLVPIGNYMQILSFDLNRVPLDKGHFISKFLIQFI